MKPLGSCGVSYLWQHQSAKRAGVQSSLEWRVLLRDFDIGQPGEPSRSASSERRHTPDTTLHLRRADPLQAMMRIETYRLPVIKMVAARRLPNQMPLTQRQTINT